jgi:hypothetical protein
VGKQKKRERERWRRIDKEISNFKVMSELSLEGLLERMAYSWNEKLKQMCM